MRLLVNGRDIQRMRTALTATIPQIPISLSSLLPFICSVLPMLFCQAIISLPKLTLVTAFVSEPHLDQHPISYPVYRPSLLL
jgi:hypothetical protein